MLGCSDDEGGRVCGNHSGKDTSVDYEKVVGAIDFGVKVDDSVSVAAAVVGS